jgi:protein-S-isoprenylcysteine O-methyltransferase Ste14
MNSQHNRPLRAWQTVQSFIVHAGLLLIACSVPFFLGHRFTITADIEGVNVGIAAWAILAVLEENIQTSPPTTVVAADTAWRGHAQRALWLVLPVCAWDAAFAPIGVAIGGPVLLLGMTLRTWSLKTLGPLFTWTAGVTEGHQVVRTGPYRYFKHPNYLGSVIFASGLVLTSGSLLGWGCVLFLAVSVFMAARHESEFLKRNLDGY